MQKLECFPTPLWSKEADKKDEINKEFLELIPKVRSLCKEGVSKTNSGGWQSPPVDINGLPLFKELILGFLEEVAVDLNIKRDAEVVLSDCWININYKDSYNRSHSHPNSLLSGCYYVKTPPNCGDIVFSDPRAQALCMLFPVEVKNKYTVQTVRFHPQAGSIVLFPSWLIHYVETNKNNKERISVAFNAVYN
jgi:uncharacterized protein (TIGR02466 family)